MKCGSTVEVSLTKQFLYSIQKGCRSVLVVILFYVSEFTAVFILKLSNTNTKIFKRQLIDVTPPLLHFCLVEVSNEALVPFFIKRAQISTEGKSDKMNNSH